MFRTLLLGLTVALPARAQNVHGILMIVKGSVKIESGQTKKITAAKVGGKVYPQDTVIAEKDARAKIVMSDKNEIHVSPETRISLENYSFNPQKDEKNVLLNVVYGKVRSSVNQKYDGEKNKFHVKTPSAVAGVRGTDFLAGYNTSTQLSTIVTFSGVVEVGTPGAGGVIANPVRVEPGQFTTLTPQAPPAPPAALPPQELGQLNQQSRAETAKADAPLPPPQAPPPPDKARQPASSTGSMVDRRDLGPAVINGGAPPDFAQHGGQLRELPPLIPPLNGLPPKCDYCERQISGGPTQLNIQINIQ